MKKIKVEKWRNFDWRKWFLLDFCENCASNGIFIYFCADFAIGVIFLLNLIKGNNYVN